MLLRMRGACVSMAGCFVVEIGRQVVGVAVRTRGGFKFFSSDRHLFELENEIFEDARALDRAVRERFVATRQQEQAVRA